MKKTEEERMTLPKENGVNSSLSENNEPVNPEVSAPEAEYEPCYHRETGDRFPFLKE